jgi:hypothetical protein
VVVRFIVRFERLPFVEEQEGNFERSSSGSGVGQDQDFLLLLFQAQPIYIHPQREEVVLAPGVVLVVVAYALKRLQLVAVQQGLADSLMGVNEALRLEAVLLGG